MICTVTIFKMNLPTVSKDYSLRYFQIDCHELIEYLENSRLKEQLWLNVFEFYFRTVPERFLLNFYIEILVYFFHPRSIGFITSAMDYVSAH